MDMRKERAKAVRDAERSSPEGYREGSFLLDGNLVEVLVNFYPVTSWWMKTAEGRVPMTSELLRRCAPSVRKLNVRRDVTVLDRRNDLISAFISSLIPGGEGQRHLAIMVDKGPGFSLIFRAVPVDDEIPQICRETFEGRDSILFAWEITGVRFMSRGVFPEDDLPAPSSDADPAP